MLLAITSAPPKDNKATYQAGAGQVGAGQVKQKHPLEDDADVDTGSVQNDVN